MHANMKNRGQIVHDDDDDDDCNYILHHGTIISVYTV